MELILIDLKPYSLWFLLLFCYSSVSILYFSYLEDWKERACLKLDELKVLFSNIQDIYEFNSQLLKRLVNSGMDPIKIAKCFIELRQEFRIYTTYW